VGQKVVAFPVAGDQSLFNNRQFAKYLYMDEPPDSLTGVSMALAVPKLKIHHPAIIFSNNPDAAPVRTGVLNGLKNLKITPAISLTVAQGAASYGTEVGRILAAHPDGIVMEISDPASAATFFANYVAQAGSLKIPFVDDATASGQQWNDAVAHAIGNPAIDAHEWIVSTQNGTAVTPNYTYMLKEWPKFNGPQPFNASFNTPIFDSVILSSLAMLEANSTVSAKWAPYVAKIDAGQPGAKKVYSYAQGKAAIAAGKTIKYIGATDGMGWNKVHSRIVPAFLYRRNGNNISVSGSGFTVAQINAAAK
jgi:branched-chain amino acid transport system substrate-binding protein